jgi:hypothetical protein
VLVEVTLDRAGQRECVLLPGPGCFPRLLLARS